MCPLVCSRPEACRVIHVCITTDLNFEYRDTKSSKFWIISCIVECVPKEKRVFILTNEIQRYIDGVVGVWVLRMIDRTVHGYHYMFFSILTRQRSCACRLFFEVFLVRCISSEKGKNKENPSLVAEPQRVCSRRTVLVYIMSSMWPYSQSKSFRMLISKDPSVPWTLRRWLRRSALRK